jgi:hypothetical protein
MRAYLRESVDLAVPEPRQERELQHGADQKEKHPDDDQGGDDDREDLEDRLRDLAGKLRGLLRRELPAGAGAAGAAGRQTDTGSSDQDSDEGHPQPLPQSAGAVLPCGGYRVAECVQRVEGHTPGSAERELKTPG